MATENRTQDAGHARFNISTKNKTESAQEFGRYLTNHITDKSATSVKAMRQAAHNILYTAANSWQYANGEPKVATPIWKTAMYVAWGVTAVLVIGLEIVAIKRYLNRKKAVATVESAAEPVAAGPANAE